NDLLVGNFGDGRINAINPRTGGFLGQLRDANDKPITIDGLWGLDFGNGANAGPTTTLFFTAGPDDEMHGLFGSLVSVNR
ncbi:MAG: TIGR03118 family protein, partial [Ktedonobacterales bacterium]